MAGEMKKDLVLEQLMRAAELSRKATTAQINQRFYKQHPDLVEEKEDWRDEIEGGK